MVTEKEQLEEPIKKKELLELGTQTKAFCQTQLIFIQILPHMFHIPLKVNIILRILSNPYLDKEMREKFPNFDQIFTHMKYITYIFDHAEYQMYVALFPVKDTYEAHKLLINTWRKLLNYRTAEGLKLAPLQFDLDQLFCHLINITELRNFEPTIEDKNNALYLYQRTFPAFYDQNVLEKIEEDMRKSQKEFDNAIRGQLQRGPWNQSV